jgi:hypothetical protein
MKIKGRRDVIVPLSPQGVEIFMNLEPFSQNRITSTVINTLADLVLSTNACHRTTLKSLKDYAGLGLAIPFSTLHVSLH